MGIGAINDDRLLGSESMLEEIRRTAERRLHQLEPLIEEAERLRDVLALLEHDSAKPAHDTGAARPAPPLKVVSEPAQRAAKGANKRMILELVGAKPGMTASDIARATGMKRTVVASTVSRLKRHGELRDHEQGGVCLVTEPPAQATVTQTSPTLLGPTRPRRAVRRHRVTSLI